jgi:D-alanine-D-alanine ligase
MVSKIDTTAALVAQIELLFAHSKTAALVEEFLTGMELTIGVIGNDEPKVLPPSQAVAAAGVLSIEEKFLPGGGQNITPAPLPADAILLAQETVKKAYQAAGCIGYARIDCFYQSAAESPTGSPRVIILEINTLPGLTPATCIFHQAAEIDMTPMVFLDTIIELGLVHRTVFEREKETAAVFYNEKDKDIAVYS